MRWMLRRTRPLVLQAGESLALEGFENRIDMGTRQLEAVSNTLLVPAFRGHADHRPARLIRLAKGRKGGQRAFALHGDVIGL